MKQKGFYLGCLIIMSSSYTMSFLTCDDKDGRVLCPEYLQWILNPMWSDSNTSLPHFF